MHRILSLLAVGLTVAGCVSSMPIDQIMASQKPPTPQLRNQIVEGARTFLKDPYSVRDAEISSIFTVNAKGYQVVCVKFNSKNGFGAYEGRETGGIGVVNGQLTGYLENTAECLNPALRWYPFPETNKLRNL
jgi:hypothetical protein